MSRVLWGSFPTISFLPSCYLKLGYDCYLDPEEKDSRLYRVESWMEPEPEPDELHRTTKPALDYQNYLSTNCLHRNKIII